MVVLAEEAGMPLCITPFLFSLITSSLFLRASCKGACSRASSLSQLKSASCPLFVTLVFSFQRLGGSHRVTGNPRFFLHEFTEFREWGVSNLSTILGCLRCFL